MRYQGGGRGLSEDEIPLPDPDRFQIRPRVSTCGVGRTDVHIIDSERTDARSRFPIPEAYGDVEAAPLLCAGPIGFRALRIAGPADRIGLYGFGAAAYIVAQVAIYEGREAFAFTRPGDLAAQHFARSLGCA